MLQQLWSNHITDIFLHNKRFCYRYSKAKVLEWVHNFVNQLFNTTLSLNSHRLFSCHLCLGCTPASKSECFQPAACTVFVSCFTEPPHSKLWTMRQCRLVRGLQTCTTHSGGIIMSHRAWKKKSNSRCLNKNKTANKQLCQIRYVTTCHCRMHHYISDHSRNRKIRSLQFAVKIS